MYKQREHLILAQSTSATSTNQLKFYIGGIHRLLLIYMKFCSSSLKHTGDLKRKSGSRAANPKGHAMQESL